MYKEIGAEEILGEVISKLNLIRELLDIILRESTLTW